MEEEITRSRKHISVSFFVEDSRDLHRIVKYPLQSRSFFFGCLLYRVYFIRPYDLELRESTEGIHLVFIKIVIKW